MTRLRILFRRLRGLSQFLRGESIVLEISGDTLIVDAGKQQSDTVKRVAGSFFKNSYSL